jgi:hypothetical protein
VCGSVWAVDFFALVNGVIPFDTRLMEFASVAISAEHFFTSIFP